ncbi:MAG: hypothetical protein M3Y27_16285 [Acidobacteriota bacterium]|nr:hypothetical protein [Acidobacteriota bacterium]
MTFLHSGATHSLRFKRRQNMMWRTAGAAQILQLLIIAPLAYLQRWDIEVNFREEKTLLGVGQTQVRHPSSAESAPALMVASYAMLLVSAQRALGISHDGLIPQPKWISSDHNNTRVSMQ